MGDPAGRSCAGHLLSIKVQVQSRELVLSQIRPMFPPSAFPGGKRAGAEAFTVAASAGLAATSR
jgi:hypothetical protein